MKLATRVFELAPVYGYGTESQLAEAMGLSQSSINKIKNDPDRGFSVRFIVGALKAFPNRSFSELFQVVHEETIAA